MVVTFYFPRQIEYAVRVEVPGNADSVDYEEALEEAYETLPGGVCAHCSGWGKKWSLDLDTMDLEAQYAEDETGNVVWGERS